MSTKSTKKIVYKNEPVFIMENGEQVPYIPKEIVTKRDVYAASLHLVLKHTADFHALMVDVLCDKYGLSAEEVIGTIREDPRILAMTTDPVLEAMGHFTKEDVEKTLQTDVDQLTERVKNLTVSASASASAPAPLSTDVPIKKARGRPKKTTL